MTADSLHTYVYAPPRSLSFTAPNLPPKAAHSIRTYEVVLTGLLQLLGQATIASAAVDADAPLVVHAASQATTTVTVVLGGGAVGARPGNLCIALLFADGTREDVVLAQPIQAASPEIPDDPVTLGSQLVTIDYQPLELTQLTPLPGGALLGDQVLTMRGSALGLTAPSQGGGGGGGGDVAEVAFGQTLPAATWTVAHNLGRHPQPRVVTTSGDLVDCAASYPDANTVVLTFASPFAGIVYL